MDILKIDNISAGYDSKIIIKNINITLKENESIAIVGESGSGKTTLVKAITHMCDIYSGDILFEGNSILKKDKKQIRNQRKYIQMIMQSSNTSFNPSMKILSYLCEPLQNFLGYKKDDCISKIKQYLPLVGLDESILSKKPQNISGGQRQRISILGSILISPKILICDEITSALDVSVGRQIMELIKDIQKKTKMSIIFICHDLPLMASVSDRLYIMNNGIIVDSISSNKLQETQNEYTKELLNSTYSIDNINK